MNQKTGAVDAAFCESVPSASRLPPASEEENTATRRGRPESAPSKAGADGTARGLRMESSPKDKEEAIRHSTTIESLAQSEGIGLEDVRSLYESVLDKMKREAVITDFLPIFAARKVKEILRVRGLPQTGTDYP